MSHKLIASLCLALALSAAQPRELFAFDWLGKIDLDAEGLKSEDPQLRLKAVRDMQRYEIEWTRDYLLSALRDEDVNVRAAAGRILAKHRIREALPIIIKWLSELDVQSKQVAADILGELGDDAAIPALVRSLGDPEPTVRVHAVEALGKIGGPVVVVPLVTRLEDDKGEVRKAAVLELRELGDARAVIPLVGLFDDSSVEVRTSAIEAVGVLHDEAAVPALLREFRENRDRAETVKIAAVTSLGNLEAERALPGLLAEFDPSNSTRASSDLRGKVAFAMAQIAAAHPAAPESQQALVKLVEALDEGAMRNAAREALLRAAGSAVPPLIEYLEGKIVRGDPLAAVEILQELRDPRATPALIAELERGRIPQETVLLALRELGDKRALLPILGLLEDKDPAVRLRAMRTLDPLLRPESEAADLIAERLTDEDPEIRLMAARYLGRMRARSAVPALSKMAKAADESSMRASALAALGRIGDKGGTPIAIEILESGPAELRAVAADVLSELRDRDATGRLMKLAQNPHLPFRHLAIEALGSTLRDSNHAGAVQLLQRVAMGGNLRDGLAAIEALSGMRGQGPIEVMLKLATSAEPERRRAALIGLGATRAASALPLLLELLGSGTDMDAAAAAWSLAEIGDPSASTALLKAARRKGQAAPVNASAALAALAQAKEGAELKKLLHHRLALVRINAMMAIARLRVAGGDEAITKVMDSDQSYLVRIAALRALSLLGSGAEAVDKLSQQDPHDQVRSAALAIKSTGFHPGARDNWSVFRVVDPQADDKAVSQEARFFVGGDGLATVSFSDARGRIVYQHFPSGSFVEGALSDLARY